VRAAVAEAKHTVPAGEHRYYDRIDSDHYMDGQLADRLALRTMQRQERSVTASGNV